MSNLVLYLLAFEWHSVCGKCDTLFHFSSLISPFGNQFIFLPQLYECVIIYLRVTFFVKPVSQILSFVKKFKVIFIESNIIYLLFKIFGFSNFVKYHFYVKFIAATGSQVYDQENIFCNLAILRSIFFNKMMPV